MFARVCVDAINNKPISLLFTFELFYLSNKYTHKQAPVVKQKGASTSLSRSAKSPDTLVLFSSYLIS